MLRQITRHLFLRHFSLRYFNKKKRDMNEDLNFKKIMANDLK